LSGDEIEAADVVREVGQVRAVGRWTGAVRIAMHADEVWSLTPGAGLVGVPPRSVDAHDRVAIRAAAGAGRGLVPRPRAGDPQGAGGGEDASHRARGARVNDDLVSGDVDRRVVQAAGAKGVDLRERLPAVGAAADHELADGA